MYATDSARLCDIIKLLTSPSIEEINLAIEFANIFLLDLAEMDSHFQRPNFASLTVRVQPYYNDYDGYEGTGEDHRARIQKWLQATFPRSLARGIIQ